MDPQQAAFTADDEIWDALLKSEASQQFMERAAAEVRTEMAAGQTMSLEDLLNEEDVEDQAGQSEVTR